MVIFRLLMVGGFLLCLLLIRHWSYCIDGGDTGYRDIFMLLCLLNEFGYCT